jgi:5-methylcytosine-specific restriction endonuclease McrA
MKKRRTYADRREAIISAVKKRRKKIKLLAIEYKGGKCQICGYKKLAAALELHHIDKTLKSFGIGEKGYTRSWQKVKNELDKCILLCANCHREVSAGITQLPEVILDDKQGELGEALNQVIDRVIPNQAECNNSEGVETIPLWEYVSIV